ncbi:MAG: hypothetical protein HY360_18165 [Verrucomicrobia bacterium]|nr:hypothetical protein [Verrucomicrobiota bacterium]
MSAFAITFDPAGKGHCLYTEMIDLRALGTLRVERATTIEFNHSRQMWEVRDREDQILCVSPSRKTCLDWEVEHLQPTERNP